MTELPPIDPDLPADQVINISSDNPLAEKWLTNIRQQCTISEFRDRLAAVTELVEQFIIWIHQTEQQISTQLPISSNIPLHYRLFMYEPLLTGTDLYMRQVFEQMMMSTHPLAELQALEHYTDSDDNQLYLNIMSAAEHASQIIAYRASLVLLLQQINTRLPTPPAPNADSDE